MTPLLDFPLDHLTIMQGAAKRMEGMTPASAVHLLKHARRTWHAKGRLQKETRRPVQAVPS